MKKLEFTTSKGDFILQDSPKELVEFTFTEATRLTIDDIAYQPLGLVKYMTEEQFAEVVDSTNKGEILTCFKDYAKGYYSNSLFTAKESFESLVKSLGWYLFKNPNGVSYSKMNDSELDYRSFLSWHEAESKTFYNPILLKKK